MKKVVLNFDMLAPAGFGEIIGGSVREDDYDLLTKRIAEYGLELENYRWYLDLRKYGSVPPRRLRTRSRKNHRMAHRRKAHQTVHRLPKTNGQSIYLVLYVIPAQPWRQESSFV